LSRNPEEVTVIEVAVQQVGDAPEWRAPRIEVNREHPFALGDLLCDARLHARRHPSVTGVVVLHQKAKAMCYPVAGCPCCECNHKLCMMWHPGHSHTMDAVEQSLMAQDNAFLDVLEAALRGETPQTRAAYAARNAGLDCAVGKYIAFYDSDDQWLPHHLTIIHGDTIYGELDINSVKLAE
jgi:hypothetical protein